MAEKTARNYEFDIQLLSIRDFIVACEKSSGFNYRDKVAVLKIADQCSNDDILDESVTEMDEIIRQFGVALSKYQSVRGEDEDE